MLLILDKQDVQKEKHFRKEKTWNIIRQYADNLNEFNLILLRRKYLQPAKVRQILNVCFATLNCKDRRLLENIGHWIPISLVAKKNNESYLLGLVNRKEENKFKELKNNTFTYRYFE